MDEPKGSDMHWPSFFRGQARGMKLAKAKAAEEIERAEAKAESALERLDWERDDLVRLEDDLRRAFDAGCSEMLLYQFVVISILLAAMLVYDQLTQMN